VVAHLRVSLAKVLLGEEMLCDVLDQCLKVSEFLLQNASGWGVEAE
jgi:hypothetical protein